MSIPSIIVGEGNWAGKSGNLLGYAVSDVKILPREFTVSRALNTATRVNASGNIEGVNANFPRIDYFGGQASLLVEPSAANGILNSTDTTTSWTLGPNLSRATIDVIGVSGTNLTVNATGNLGSDGRISRANNNFSLVSGSTYTISFFIKKTGTHTIGGYYANITGAAGGDLAAGFDVSGSFNSGLIYGSAGTTNRIRRVEQWGTDVFRCSETFTMTASGTLSGFFLAPIVSVTSPINSANGTQLGFAAPQIELGSVPTSFIPTTTGSVTRNADVISVTGVAGLIGQTEGTIYAEVDVRVLGDGRFATLSDGTSNNRIQCRFNAAINGIDFLIVVAGSSVGFSVSNSSHPSFPATIPAGTYKIALGYKQNDYVVAMNGVAYTPTVTTRNVPSNFSKVTLGADVSDLNQFNNRIRAASIYQTRLPNTTTDGSPSLQSITTL
jgi:hypothetical protein